MNSEELSMISTHVPSMHSIINYRTNETAQWGTCCARVATWAQFPQPHKSGGELHRLFSDFLSCAPCHATHINTKNPEIKIFSGDLAPEYCHGLLKASLDCPLFSIMPGLTWFSPKYFLRALQLNKMIQNVQIGGFKKLSIEEAVQNVLVATEVWIWFYIEEIITRQTWRCG